MRIGAAVSLPPYRPSNDGRTAPHERSPQSNPDPQRAAAPVTPEWLAQAQRSESRSFYSAERSLSFSGRAAIDTYVTNAGLMWQPGEAELLGIDLYA